MVLNFSDSQSKTSMLFKDSSLLFKPPKQHIESENVFHFLGIKLNKKELDEENKIILSIKATPNKLFLSGCFDLSGAYSNSIRK